MTIGTEELRRWISDDRRHGVNINSGVLNDICAEVLALRAQVEVARGLAEAVRHEREMVCQDMGLQIAASDAVDTALAAWEATQ